MDPGSATVDSGRLLELYRRYLGEPERVSDVYVGFGLFLAGVMAAVVGLAVFLWSTNVPTGSEAYWQLREFAIAASMLALPASLSSVVVLLPVERRAIYASTLGGAVCLLAVAFFVANYPGNWDVTGDAVGPGVAIYGVGLVVSTAAVGAALISNYVEHARVATGGDAGTDDGASDEPQVSDERVRADIDDAMETSELSWGGVEVRETSQVTVRADDADVDRSGFDTARVDENRATGEDVENAVAGLRTLRGGEAAKATGEGTEDQADALQSLRERKAAEAASQDDTFVDRLRDRLNF